MSHLYIYKEISFIVLGTEIILPYPLKLMLASKHFLFFFFFNYERLKGLKFDFQGSIFYAKKFDQIKVLNPEKRTLVVHKHKSESPMFVLMSLSSKTFLYTIIFFMIFLEILCNFLLICFKLFILLHDYTYFKFMMIVKFRNDKS